MGKPCIPMLSREAALALVAVLAFGKAQAQEGPDLGVEASAEEIAAWDISISPDGTGLPAGSGTASVGASIYAIQCLVCHGAEGGGQPNDRLAGGHGSLDQVAPIKTVGSYWPFATTVFDYIRRAMPYLQPQSLTNDEVYALTAYILFLNGIVEENETIDAHTLPEVQMPNQESFILAYP